MNTTPQWFDMEGPGGVRVAEKLKLPALELPKNPDTTSSKDHPLAPSGVVSGGGGGGGDPNT
eukprot:8135570-Karenia_brevis.AAC.1